eukprot:scaffold1912_cov135-Cylindrotheca_fusiformis.AAC.3
MSSTKGPKSARIRNLESSSNSANSLISPNATDSTISMDSTKESQSGVVENLSVSTSEGIGGERDLNEEKEGRSEELRGEEEG